MTHDRNHPASRIRDYVRPPQFAHPLCDDRICSRRPSEASQAGAPQRWQYVRVATRFMLHHPGRGYIPGFGRGQGVRATGPIVASGAAPALSWTFALVSVPPRVPCMLVSCGECRQAL
jgi:hypothetical protein